MYLLKSSVCLERTIGAQWTNVDLSEVLIGSAYQQYKNFFLILSHPSSPDDLYVDMSQVAVEAYSFNGTITEWLRYIGDNALPFVSDVPSTKRKFVKYANAVQAGYITNFAKMGYNYTSRMPGGSLTDISLQRDQFKTNMELIGKGCLVTVNGVIHRTASNDKKAYAIEGGTTVRHSNNTAIGIISFLDIGKLTQVSLDPAKILPVDNETYPSDSVVITLDEELDLENKSFFLVLMGSFVFINGNSFKQIGERSFLLHLSLLNYEERLMDAHKLIDLSPAGFTAPNNAPSFFSFDEIRSLEGVRKILTLSQSFFVILDTPNLYIEKHGILKASFPGQFRSYTDPVYPLMVNGGRMVDYWKVEENGVWTVDVTDSYYRRYVLSEGDRDRAHFASDALDTTRRYEHGEGHFLEISTIKE